MLCGAVKFFCKKKFHLSIKSIIFLSEDILIWISISSVYFLVSKKIFNAFPLPGNFTLDKFRWTNFVTRNSHQIFPDRFKKSHQIFPVQNLFPAKFVSYKIYPPPGIQSMESPPIFFHRWLEFAHGCFQDITWLVQWFCGAFNSISTQLTKTNRVSFLCNLYACLQTSTSTRHLRWTTPWLRAMWYALCVWLGVELWVWFLLFSMHC